MQNFGQVLSGKVCPEEESFAGHEPNALKLVGPLHPPDHPGTVAHNLGNHANALNETRVRLAEPGSRNKTSLGREQQEVTQPIVKVNRLYITSIKSLSIDEELNSCLGSTSLLETQTFLGFEPRFYTKDPAFEML